MNDRLSETELGSSRIVKLILVDINPQMCAQWRTAFDGLENVEIVRGPFQSLDSFDCFVSASNSFAFMDGGVDKAIRDHFGIQLQATAQRTIIEKWGGELPVGACEIIPTGNTKHPWLALTPTMRTPKPIVGTDVPYTAMWAMLNAVRRHGQIASVACPGLGTAIGRYPLDKAAQLMALAYRNFLRTPVQLTTGRALATEQQISDIIHS